MNFHGDVMLNLSNMLCGYNEDRVYSFIPYVGAGFVHTGKGPGYDELGINAGLINRFRLSSASIFIYSLLLMLLFPILNTTT